MPQAHSSRVVRDDLETKLRRVVRLGLDGLRRAMGPRAQSPNASSHIAPAASARGFILGTVPDVAADGAVDCVAFCRTHPQSDFARSIDRLTTKLLAGSSDPAQGRVVMLSALTPREGTTSLSLCIAAAAARAGKVLLIDADQARRGLSKRLALDRHRGLSDIVAGDCFANKLVVREDLFGVLPFGRLALDDQSMAWEMPAFLVEARARFALVLIDASAFDTGTQSAHLAAYADGVALVTCWDDLLRDDFIAFVDTIADRPNFAGIILNRAKDRDGEALALVG